MGKKLENKKIECGDGNGWAALNSLFFQHASNFLMFYWSQKAQKDESNYFGG